MDIKFISSAIVKKAIPVIFLCSGMFVANMAHAGWLADFLCYGDNDPGLCKSRLPDSFQTAPLPTQSDAVVSVLKQASKLKGGEKNAFLEQNRQLILGVSSSNTEIFDRWGKITTKKDCGIGGGVWAGEGGKGSCTGPKK